MTELRIRARRLVRGLAAITVLLLALHVAETWLRLVGGHRSLLGLAGTFDMNYENNVPTFFAGLLLLGAAALLAAVGSRPDLAVRDRPYWRWLALLFLLLALDEQASLHELVVDWIQRFVPLGGLFYFAWVIPYGIGVVVLGLCYLRFLLRQPAPARWRLLLAGTLYLAGALGMEMLGGAYLSAHDDQEDFHYALLVGLEESLELAGLVLFIATLLACLMHEGRDACVHGLQYCAVGA